ncbi:AarF/ABC1/UbiB kinase family protein [Dactylosporangium aurantiacum]|uniref:AarF/ABC1/UbiB kinase family protein n=1 Tax=Dactylosporangium aurantiacum TaxID=35754 RepID=A0A9Q9ME53_9ACTN|nr:AarF/ABC1/UbiB kinase family protein [Dactylosporangium aurantiacum]MDG6106894.1 AarF/ABC1/UbiB kinase family protein [Dactylosporangium aurantiacum]UWZ51025.1 AarF/ABC1/UbiB kinase family protein [Dactylosporangium aurantiacum]
MGSLWVWLWVVVTVLGLVAAMAAVARRLLGVAFGRVRLLLAGLAALLVSGPISRAMSGSVPRDTTSAAPLWLLILAVVTSLVVAMVFLVIAEALVPTGRFRPLLWLRGVRARSRRTRRYLQILAIVVRHGLGPYLRGRRAAAPAARSLRQALEEGGLTFVKLGQVLSTRRDLVPGEFVEELSTLRDRAAPIAWDDVRAVLEAEFGAPVGELFADIEQEPLAAASVAQVHAATLRSGASVVVKVQRPGIRAVVDRDLDIVGRLAATLEARTRWGRTAGAVGLAAGFTQAVHEELDFRIEARNMTAVAAADPAGPVTIPVPLPDLCTERVLVMSRLDGVPLHGARAVLAARGVDTAELARTLLYCVLRQILVAGVFHADPHPGNALLLTDGRLGLLDFGSVGRLDGGVREALQRLLLSLDRGDPAGATDALLGVVARPDEVDEERLERSLGQFMARHLSTGGGTDPQLFRSLLRLVAEYELTIPPEVAAVFRALTTLEGGLAELSGGFDVMTEARGFAQQHFAEMWRPSAVKQALTEELTTLVPVLRRLPRRVDRIAAALERGRLGVNVRLFADERDRRHVSGLVHQVLLTVLSGVAGIMAVLLLGTAGGPMVTAAVSLYALFAYNLLAIAAILALRVLIGIFRTGP